MGVVGARGSIPSTQSLTIIRLGVVGARGPIPSTQSLTIIRLGVVGARGSMPSTQSPYYYKTPKELYALTFDSILWVSFPSSLLSMD